MKDTIRNKKRASRIYFRSIITTYDLVHFKKMTEKYRKYRKVYLINDVETSIFGEQIKYSYLELRTIKNVYRYVSLTLPHYEEF